MSGLSRLLDGLWRVLASPRLTLALLIWLTCVVGFSLVIPQTPYRLEDPLQRSQWLSGVPREMWPVMESLQPWGMFQLLSSAWLRLPLALLLAHALVMLAAGAPAAWQRARGHFVASVPGSLAWSRLGRQLTLTPEAGASGVDASRRLRERVAGAGYRVWSREGVDGWIARRQPRGWLAYIGLYTGFALLAAGLLLQGWLGQVIEIDLQPGQAVRLPVEGRTTLVLDDVALPAGHQLAAAEGLVTLRTIGEIGAEDTFDLPLHHSRLVQGAWLTAIESLPVVDVSATDALTGRDVLLQPLVGPGALQTRVRLRLNANPDERFAGVPAQNVTLRVDYVAEESVTAGRLVVRFFRGVETAPGLVAEVGEDEVAEFDGVRYYVALDQDIRLRAQIGLWWIAAAAGWVLVAVSAILLAAVRPVWLVAWIVDGTRKSRLVVFADALAGEHAMHRDVAGLTESWHEEAHEHGHGDSE